MAGKIVLDEGFSYSQRLSNYFSLFSRSKKLIQRFLSFMGEDSRPSAIRHPNLP